VEEKTFFTHKSPSPFARGFRSRENDGKRDGAREVDQDSSKSGKVSWVHPRLTKKEKAIRETATTEKKGT